MAKFYTYALYDSRYSTNPDDAICYTTEDTLREARQSKREAFTDAVIVRELLEERDGDLFCIESEIVI